MSILSIDLHSSKSTIRLSFHFQNVTFSKFSTGTRSHRSRAVTAYLQSEAVTSVPWPAMSPDLNPIEHIWDMLGRRITCAGASCAKHSLVGRALHLEWQQLSQQDIRRLTGGMRRRVEVVIQARGGYIRYWTLKKWRFESEMTILSCFLNCEGQYLKWTYFTAKTGLG
jgi:hypothetical protein